MCLLTPQQETKCDPPSTSFSRAVRLCPFGARLRSARYARLRSASPRRGQRRRNKDNLQKHFYTPLGHQTSFCLVSENLILGPPCNVWQAAHFRERRARIHTRIVNKSDDNT